MSRAEAFPVFRDARPCRAVRADPAERHLGLQPVLTSAEPAILLDSVGSVHSLTDALSGDHTPLRIDVSPERDAPVKYLGNGTLVRPAERVLPMQQGLAVLRNASRGYAAYTRYFDLQSLPTSVREALPLSHLLRLAGPRIVSSNLWLGDGSMRSSLHYDGMDNLLAQRRVERAALAAPRLAIRRLGLWAAVSPWGRAL